MCLLLSLLFSVAVTYISPLCKQTTVPFATSRADDYFYPTSCALGESNYTYIQKLSGIANTSTTDPESCPSTPSSSNSYFLVNDQMVQVLSEAAQIRKLESYSSMKKALQMSRIQEAPECFGLELRFSHHHLTSERISAELVIWSNDSTGFGKCRLRDWEKMYPISRRRRKKIAAASHKWLWL
ncbi:hypothetical protein H5410_033555 [Solanum commersonii]|uniref:Uncharacterized protein n=1 Tax=Solanum commersonii TaxID=4109 RepID=A0A9J5YP12_SOLCO|nr:hypothetical protein H5410_033555 [Solanum commersonii]